MSAGHCLRNACPAADWGATSTKVASAGSAMLKGCDRVPSPAARDELVLHPAILSLVSRQDNGPQMMIPVKLFL
jgi:hypothetical protein